MTGIEPGVGAAALKDKFLSGMASAACTVNVVTTDGPAGRHGATVSAMSSVSADSPRPTLLVCMNEKSATAGALIRNGVFCVNILRDDQSYISDCFADRYATADGDKFSCAEWATLATGAPRVVDPLVAFDCRLTSHQKIGTHHVFVGEVEDIFRGPTGSPLIYANRAYGTPARHLPRTVLTARFETLRLGTFHTFGPWIVPLMLERLVLQGHNVELKLVEGDQRRVQEALLAGEVDVALMYDYDLGPELVKHPILDVEPYALLPAEHPLARGPAVSLKQLVEEPMILLDSAPSGEYFLSLFRAAGLEPRVRARTLSFEMVRGLVGRGLGFSILVTKPAAPMSYDGRALTTRPLAEATDRRRIVVARRASGPAHPVARSFFDLAPQLLASQD